MPKKTEETLQVIEEGAAAVKEPVADIPPTFGIEDARAMTRGERNADSLYKAVAIAGGFGDSSYNGKYPVLDLSGLKGDYKTAVAAVLKGELVNE